MSGENSYLLRDVLSQLVMQTKLYFGDLEVLLRRKTSSQSTYSKLTQIIDLLKIF